MNAYRKAGIVVIGALASMAIGLSPALAQGHSGGGHSSGGGGGGAHAHYSGGGHSAGGYGTHYTSGYRGGASYYGRGGSYYGHGGAYYGPGGYHGGGYWRGGFWYGPRFGFGWYLPVLPAFYATYWFGGIPYYYANDSYYTWNPEYNGYVQTDPPAGTAADDGSTAPPPGAAPPPSGAQTYNYPKNGQSADQEATDRYQCHQWAVSQSGYDPMRNNPGAAGQVDYSRALTACMEGRGYSVR